MKILHVIPSVDARSGGPIEGVKQMGATLQAMGHQVEVASLDAPGEPWTQDFSLPLHTLGPSRLGGFRYSAKWVPWLKQHAKDYDAVVVDGLWQYHGFGTWRALHGSGTPYVVFTHGMLDPWFKRTYPLKHLKKWLYWPWSEYRLLRDAATVLFTCEEEKLQARESFWLYKCRETVVPFGTRLPPQDAEPLRARFLAAHPELQGKRLLLFLSRIHEKKGCDLLVDAFCGLAAGHPDLHLVLVGPDDAGAVPGFLAQAKEAGLAEQVSWLGMLKGDDKWGAFHACDAFALPSHQENFGIAVAEAMGCSKPVLISNKVNIWREIEAGGGGIVGDDTLEGTRQTLLQWMKLSPQASQAMGQKAYATFVRQFTVESMAKGMLEVLRQVLKK
jgi:glycosyltransferase involved in cell wall biosynthesis